MANLTRKSVTSTVSVRFWPKVDTSGGANTCWLWTGKSVLPERQGINGPTSGYGLIGLKDDDGIFRRIGTHRLAYLICVGEIPDGLMVLHHCDTPRCCNPAHLFLGDSKANSQDCLRKGRNPLRLPVLVKNGQEIYRRYIQGESATTLAEAFGVSRRSIYKEINRLRETP